MEIVIGFLFLIGAVILGTNAPASEEARANERLAARTEQASTAHVLGSRPCRYAGGPPVQRDLTVPRAPAARLGRHPIEAPGHACSDE